MLHLGFFKQHQYRMRMSLKLIFLLVLFNCSNALAGISHNPKYDWYTIETTHFRVHYHNGEQQLAKLTANIAERVHSNLSEWIKWQPVDKTDLVLTDEFDISNGFATPFPSNRSQLYISPPDDVSSLEDHSSWLETLITHEYLHILHLDKAIKSAAVWRYLFGRNPFFLFNTFPAGSLPTWGVEGLATYKETDEKRGIGRGQSSYFNMLMRLEVKNGIKPVHQVNQRISSWPLGTTSYLYGVNYYQFIEKNYGENKINDLVDVYASTFFPFRINNNTTRVVNKDLVVLWSEFNDYLQKKHKPKIKAITKQGIAAGKQLTDNGFFDESLTALPDGTLFYISYDAQRNPALMMRNGKFSKKLMRVVQGTRLDVHPTAGLLIAQPNLCDNSEYLYDLYKMDLSSGSVDRLTKCARYRTASWSPDGNQIVAVHNKLGKNELVLLDDKGTKIKSLWQGAQWQVVSHVKWSPDGGSLVATVYREKSGWNLELFDFKKSKWNYLTKNSVIQAHPSFSLDGKSIYYSAEHDGVYNVFNISLNTKKVTQISNVLGAAFYPVPVNAKGDIFYLGHNTQGMDLYHLPATQQKSNKIVTKEIQNKTTGMALSPAPEVKTTKAEDYSPWSSLRPRWWFPLFAFGDDISLVGFTTSSSDVLDRHTYVTSLAYDFKNELAVGSMDYIYDRYWPIFKLHFDRDINILYGSDDKFARTKVNDTSQFETVLPFLGLMQRFSMHFAYGNEVTNDARRAEGVPKAKEFNYKYYGASLVYTNATRNPRGISRNEGRQLSFTIEDSDEFKDSFYTGTVKTFDWREFVPLGGAHVLAFRVVAGRGDQGSKQFQLGGSTSSVFLPPLLRNTLVASPFNLRTYNLRGYSSGLLALTGNNMNVISTEYRFPIFKFERGFMTPPIGLHEIYAAVFYDSGAAWNNNQATPEKYYAGTGIEITTAATFFFHARLDIVTGFSHGLDKDLGEDQVYLRLDASF